MTLDKSISHCHKHIMWTSITCPDRPYVISMVMPTLNFSTYRISTSVLVPGDIITDIVSLSDELRSVRRFTKYNLRVLSDVSNRGYILVCGTMAHWYIRRMPYTFSLISCSVGSSVMQVHRLGTLDEQFTVKRLATINANLIHEML